MLQRDPEKRPTAVQLLHHPWLTRLDGGSGSSSSGGGSSSSRGSEGVDRGEGAGLEEEAPLNDTLVQRLQRYGTYGRLKQVRGTTRRLGGGAAKGCGGTHAMACK
jgi:calcium-dependent protein kinase